MILAKPYWYTYIQEQNVSVSQLSKLLSIKESNLYAWVRCVSPSIHKAVDFKDRFNNYFGTVYDVEELWQLV